jgi:hypothetical protein
MLVLLHLYLAFICRTSSATFKRVSSDPQLGYKGVVESLSSCASFAFSLAAALDSAGFLRSSSGR